MPQQKRDRGRMCSPRAAKMATGIMGMCMVGYIAGPPLYWHLMEVLANVHRFSCPPCVCDCSSFPLFSLPEGLNFSFTDCRSFIPEQVGVSKEAGGVTFGGSQTRATTAKTNLPILVKQPILGVNYSTVTADEHNSPKGSLQQPNKAHVFDRPTSLEPDPRARGGDNQPENYESKVKDPTGRGGQEIGATPILHSLDKMNMYNDQGVVHHNSGTQGLADKAALAKDVLASKLMAAPVQTSSVTDYGKKVASTVYDKGVSAKEYIAEKVSPKEEDKALSEVISGALPVSSGKDDDNEKTAAGKVTFTTKVVRQLGAEDEKDIGSGGSGPGETVVDLLKDTVTSWLGVGGSNEPSTLVYHDIPQTGNNEGLDDHNHHTADGKPRLE